MIDYEHERTIDAVRLRRGLPLLREFLAYAGLGRACPIVHVAGSKGKGTVCLMLARLLNRRGYSTGVFTSPHLRSVLERFAIDDEPCDPARYESADSALRGIWRRFLADTGRAPETELTFFEWSTVLALALFERERVDCVVLETGLGGRDDATNIITPVVSIITSISYEHAAILGPRLLDIADHKFGIVKHGVPLVYSLASPLLFPGGDECGPNGSRRVTAADIAQLRALAQRVAGSLAAPAVEVAEIDPRLAALTFATPGALVRWNATLARRTAEVLAPRFPRLADGDWPEILAATVLPGRFELMARSPAIVFDGAHNRESMRALCETVLSEYARSRRVVMFGCNADKDVEGMFLELRRVFHEIVFVRTENESRSLDPAELMAQWRATPGTAKIGAATATDPYQWLANFRAAHRDDDVVLCVTGSFYCPRFPVTPMR